jgi:Fe-S-cluster containining protein
MPRILDGLPVLYRDLFPDFFRNEVPVETKATCSSCAMLEKSCQGSKVESVDKVNHFFRPDTKCCTYYPRLPNYLVGALLSDERPELAEGRRRMEEKVASRVGVTPQWLRPSARYNFLYRNARQAFGRSPSLLCPYYESGQGNCTIWPYREAVCSTFFCKYVAGADGRKFWMSLKTWLTLAEIQLSRFTTFKLLPDYVLTGKDRPDASGEALTAEDLDDKPLPDKEYAGLWREWVGREADFYRASYELVRALPAGELERLLGLDGTIELAVLEKLYQAAVSPKLPRVLQFNPAATVKWLPDGSVALGSYSENDAVALPGEAYGLLVEFTGKAPVEAVRQHLREHKQADLHEDILVELYRHRILIEA